MRNKILRRKDWIFKRALRRKYPGFYKVFSDYGYGDCSIVERDLTITEAILVVGRMRGYRDKSLSVIAGTHKVSRFWIDDLARGTYRIVENDQIMPCEEPGFDWMDS